MCMYSSYRVFQDIDEQSDVLTQLNQSYKQIKSGQYRGTLWSMYSEQHIAVHIESANSSMLQAGMTPADQICLGIMQRQSQSCLMNGLLLSQEIGIILPPNTYFDTRFNDSTQFMLMCFPAHLILDSHTSLPSSIKPIHLDLLPDLSRKQLISASPFHLLDALTDPLIFDEIRTCIIDQFNELPVLRKNSKNDYKLYCKFHDWIMAHIQDKILIESASHDLGISRRHLEICFKAITGMSPQKYIYMFKLNAIHRILKQRSDKNITELAHEWHVPHVGRFSQDYKRLFGESPSTTIRRLHTYSP